MTKLTYGENPQPAGIEQFDSCARPTHPNQNRTPVTDHESDFVCLGNIAHGWPRRRLVFAVCQAIVADNVISRAGRLFAGATTGNGTDRKRQLAGVAGLARQPVGARSYRRISLANHQARGGPHTA